MLPLLKTSVEKPFLNGFEIILIDLSSHRTGVLVLLSHLVKSEEIEI